jgi:hypothetical protein
VQVVVRDLPAPLLMRSLERDASAVSVHGAANASPLP